MPFSFLFSTTTPSLAPVPHHRLFPPASPRGTIHACYQDATLLKRKLPHTGRQHQKSLSDQWPLLPTPNSGAGAPASATEQSPCHQKFRSAHQLSLSDRIYCSFSACMECRNLTSPLLPVPRAKRHLLARTRTAKYAWMD